MFYFVRINRRITELNLFVTNEIQFRIAQCQTIYTILARHILCVLCAAAVTSLHCPLQSGAES